MVEKRLKRFLNEIQSGLREGSIITSQSSEIASADEEESVWTQIRKELEDVGITADDFAANREFIIVLIKKAVQDGMFKELPLSRRSRIVSSIAASTDVAINHLKIGDPIIVTAIAPQDSVSRPLSPNFAEEKIPVMPTPAVERAQKITTTSSLLSSNTIKPQARLLSRRARFMTKITNPVINYDRDLIDAATGNKLNNIRTLLKYADPTKPFKGSTAVQKAIEHSSIGVLQIFLESGVNVDHEAKPDETALMVAIRASKVDVIETLLDYGADVNLLTRTQTTALLLAAENSRDDIIRLLLKRGARADLAGKRGKSPLHVAATRNDLRSALLLFESGAKVDLRDDDGQTALMLAARAGHTKLCSLFLSRGADAYLRDNAGLAALTYASRNGDIDTCKELLSEGRQFNQGNDIGVNPAEVCQIDMALLLAARASSSKKRQHGWRRDLANLLLQHGANINAGVGKQNTALHEAASHNSLSLIEIFLAKGADINAKNDKGQTPLHLAAQNGQTSTLYVLIQKGADIASADREGKTTLHHAVMSKQPDMVRDLMGLAAGSKLNCETKDRSGKTALRIASEGQMHPNMLRVLQGRPWVENDQGS